MASPNYAHSEPYLGSPWPALSDSEIQSIEQHVERLQGCQEALERATKQHRTEKTPEAKQAQKQAHTAAQEVEEALAQLLFNSGVEWFEHDGVRVSADARIHVLSFHKGKELEAREWLAENSLSHCLKPDGRLDVEAAVTSQTLPEWPDHLFLVRGSSKVSVTSAVREETR